MTTVEFITALFYEVDEQMCAVPKHPDAHLWPSEVITLGLLHALQQEGVCVTLEAARRLSPYLNGHLKRFGQYGLDMTIQPEPLELKTLFGMRA